MTDRIFTASCGWLSGNGDRCEKSHDMLIWQVTQKWD